MKLKFYKNCVDHGQSDVHLLNECIERERQVTRRTFLKHVNKRNLAAVERGLGYEAHPSRGLTMAGDYHVRYHKSRYNGRPCVYFVWSSIEYIFTESGAAAPRKDE